MNSKPFRNAMTRVFLFFSCDSADFCILVTTSVSVMQQVMPAHSALSNASKGHAFTVIHINPAFTISGHSAL